MKKREETRQENKYKSSYYRNKNDECDCDSKFEGINYLFSLWKPFSLYSFQAPLLNQKEEVSRAEVIEKIIEENEMLKDKVNKYQECTSKILLIILEMYPTLIADEKE